MATPARTGWPVVLPERLLRGFPDRWFGFDLPDLPGWPDQDTLRIEELRDDDTLVVRAEMPGIDPQQDVEITVDDGDLCIRAERRESHEEKGEGTYRSEFRYGRFTRHLALPPGAAADDVTATYADGILEVRVPLSSSSAGATRIPVTRPGAG